MFTRSSYATIALLLMASGPAWSQEPVKLRIVSFNVEFSARAKAEEIGKFLKSLNLDVACFSEAPGGDWSERVAKAMGVGHSYVGRISSANHKDKYKSIVSRTPLTDASEVKLKGRGWNPASAVRATTVVAETPVCIYSLHIAASPNGPGAAQGHAHSLAEVLKEEKATRVIVAGDFNNRLPDDAMKLVEDAGFRATWRDLPKVDLAKSYTWNALQPTSKEGVIDHILYKMPEGAKVVDGGIIELQRPLSDHKPIWAEIQIPRTKPR